MPPRELVWTPGAVGQLAETLARMSDRASVRRCVEQHLHAAANDLETTARKWDGPIDGIWIYRFQCEDRRNGKVVVINLQAELEATDHIVGVLACSTIRL